MYLFTHLHGQYSFKCDTNLIIPFIALHLTSLHPCHAEKQLSMVVPKSVSEIHTQRERDLWNQFKYCLTSHPLKKGERICLRLRRLPLHPHSLHRLQYFIVLLKPTSFSQADSTALVYSVQASCWSPQQKRRTQNSKLKFSVHVVSALVLITITLKGVLIMAI